MIIEIFYRGRLIAETEVPNHMDMSEIDFAFRVESKMQTAEVFEIDFEKVAKFAEQPKSEKTRKRGLYEPRAYIPQKEVVKFDRPKAEYSNKSFSHGY